MVRRLATLGTVGLDLGQCGTDATTVDATQPQLQEEALGPVMA